MTLRDDSPCHLLSACLLRRENALGVQLWLCIIQLLLWWACINKTQTHTKEQRNTLNCETPHTHTHTHTHTHPPPPNSAVLTVLCAQRPPRRPLPADSPGSQAATGPDAADCCRAQQERLAGTVCHVLRDQQHRHWLRRDQGHMLYSAACAGDMFADVMIGECCS